jgi:hypothetical protein
VIAAQFPALLQSSVLGELRFGISLLFGAAPITNLRKKLFETAKRAV